MAYLISCLAVTLPLPERREGLRRVIADYQAQDWSPRELVVVINGGDPASHDDIYGDVDRLADRTIRVVAVPGIATLGALRNAAVGGARGDILCQWDDDDRYHPQRLSAQMAHLESSDAAAVLLGEVVQHVTAEDRLYVMNWAATEPEGFPGSILWRAKAGMRYASAGPQSALGEDSEALAELRSRHRVVSLDRAPWLYVYRSHGGNSWSDAHHRMLREKLSVSRGLLARRERELRAGLAPLRLGALTVAGNNGTAFVMDP